MAWITPVTDRTQADVDYVSELNEKYLDGTITDVEKVIFQDDLKGALNFADLERIQNNMQEVSDVLSLSLTVTEITEDVFRQSLMTEIDDNIQYIYDTYEDIVDIEACTVPEDLQAHAHYCYWNWLEEVLSDVYKWSQNIFYYYMGNEISMGDETGFLL